MTSVKCKRLHLTDARFPTVASAKVTWDLAALVCLKNKTCSELQPYPHNLIHSWVVQINKRISNVARQTGAHNLSAFLLIFTNMVLLWSMILLVFKLGIQTISQRIVDQQVRSYLIFHCYSITGGDTSCSLVFICS